MNWLGGARARAQQNNRRGAAQQPQQNPRRPNPNGAGM